MLRFAEDQAEKKEVEMESITGEGQLFDVGSLYAEFCQLKDSRKARGKRYRLETILILILLAKICVCLLPDVFLLPIPTRLWLFSAPDFTCFASYLKGCQKRICLDSKVNF